MKILIATPLYPPDIAGHAPYVKELATRLRATHDVTVLAYNHIPETVAGVRIVTIEKSQPMMKRLFVYTRLLYTLAKKSDVVLLQNGPSTELPSVLIAPLVRTPFILRLGDETALMHAHTEKFHRLLLRAAMHCATIVVTHEASANCKDLVQGILPSKKIQTLTRPLARPEILPFAPFPADAMHTYEVSWEKHITELGNILTV